MSLLFGLSSVQLSSVQLAEQVFPKQFPFAVSSMQLAEQVFPKQFLFVRLSSLHPRISTFQIQTAMTPLGA